MRGGAKRGGRKEGTEGTEGTEMLRKSIRPSGHHRGRQSKIWTGGYCIKIDLPRRLILGKSYSLFLKTYWLTENQSSGKTYFYTVAPSRRLDDDESARI